MFSQLIETTGNVIMTAIACLSALAMMYMLIN